MNQQDYVQIIKNLAKSMKEYHNIYWHDGNDGGRNPEAGFTASHKTYTHNQKKVIDKTYVDEFHKRLDKSYIKNHYKHREPITIRVSKQQALLYRLKYGDSLKYFDQDDGRVLVVSYGIIISD